MLRGSKSFFPKDLKPDSHGLVAVGGDFRAEFLLEAYQKGIFPWPQPDLPPLWFSPDPRGILRCNDVHLSRSLKRSIRKAQFVWTWNQAFERVIRRCQQAFRKDQGGTWITEDLLKGYLRLFERNRAYSLECWEGAELVSGLYGVWIGNFVSGESMFTARDDASKMAIVMMTKILESQGVAWLDTQMVSGVVGQMGGKEIPRKEFLKMLHDVFNLEKDVPRVDPGPIWKSLQEFV
ncbi:MAG: leucyl/phenylalanyl-tRNA--protein transferase [Bdellovibrionales bacterium]|nr:leucyl/phenylalanyl-tRNA--protein transferase [Bdellovibrionales bacterium]